MSKQTASTKAANAAVLAYCERYAANRGLKPSFPRICNGMMREPEGWPVRNADGGANIAYFETSDLAEAACMKAFKAFSRSMNSNG